MNAQLAPLEQDAAITSPPAAAAARFRSLIRTLHERAGRRVVVLVDEYDKPILDALDAPEVARANRDFLRGLYGVVKDCDAHVRFTFLTGGRPGAELEEQPLHLGPRAWYNACRCSTAASSTPGG